MTNPARNVVALRRELAQAERILREKAEKEARRLAMADHRAWQEAQDACFAFNRIRQNVNARLEAIQNGDPERFLNEQELAQMALRDADRADAAYTILSFAGPRDRLRYLSGGAKGDAVVRETLECGGVYTRACGGRHFQEIVR